MRPICWDADFSIEDICGVLFGGLDGVKDLVYTSCTQTIDIEDGEVRPADSAFGHLVLRQVSQACDRRRLFNDTIVATDGVGHTGRY